MSSEAIVTDRLVLRGVREGDAKAMFKNWTNDPAVCEFLSWSPHGSLEVTEALVQKWVEEEKKPETLRYLITEKGEDEPLGSIDVVRVRDGCPEIGYCLSKRCWGKGYMTEACKALIARLFELGFSKVVIRANVNNARSNRVIQKCGFRFIRVDEEVLSPEKGKKRINYYEIEKQ